jgi:hypothetical protein
MNGIPGQNPIVVGYLRGEVSLELAANELARAVRAVTRAFERGELRIPNEFVAQSAEPYEFTEADHSKLRTLWDLVAAKTDTTEERAQKYLESAGDSALDQTVRAIAADVKATLGAARLPTVWSFAADAQSLDPDHAAWQFIENVQQYFQDTFVDTTWPACPRHPNHPMNHTDGFWCCPRDGALARLGELSGLARGT